MFDLDSNLLNWITDDLQKAREMLERFTPPLLMPSTGFDCSAKCRQLFYIGGDYYDFICKPDLTSIFAIGDVSGKGISAALMLANLRASLHNEMQQATANLTGAMTKLNRLIYEASPEGRYITLFYAQYDPNSSRLHYINAGHNNPLLFKGLSRENPKELDVGGLPLGMMLKLPLPYRQGTETLRAGDVLVAYTDGISEITNPSGEEWGLDNLKKTVRNYFDSTSAEIIKRVLDAADAHSKGEKPIDDMTLVVLKVI